MKVKVLNPGEKVLIKSNMNEEFKFVSLPDDGYAPDASNPQYLVTPETRVAYDLEFIFVPAEEAPEKPEPESEDFGKADAGSATNQILSELTDLKAMLRTLINRK